ncbi:MAG: O-antigen ligase family protein [Paludibacter sp.]|nr:O-antigen ligase family protein [Paludibacter sp.]
MPNSNQNNSNINDSHILKVISIIVGLGLLLIGAIYFFSKDNLMMGLSLLLFIFPVIYLYFVFKSPRIGFISVLYANYFAIGLSRYLPAPMGLTVDALLVLTWVSLIFSQFNKEINWKLAAKDYTLLAIIWFVMTFLQLFNPEAVSREAWFYAMRGQGLYIFLTIPLVYLIFNKPKDFETLITLCAWFTLFAIAKGLMQKYMGVDRWEQQWLNVPGNRTTHILNGQLRVFSIFSDAGTYGSSMGYFGVLFSVLGIHESKKSKKFFYFFVGFASLYAMLISGTRSSIAVPLVGFVMYTILTKKFKIMITVGSIIFILFFILKYTTIGQGNYDVRRMRSAFSENNESLNVRMENREIFAQYLKTRPFGGGIGSAGNWGMRFSPNTLLAQTATDGFYIQIWAEQGIVGLSFYLFMIFYIVLKATFLIFFKLKNPKNITIAIGFTCGMYGLMVTSYSASSLGQMPNIIIVFASMALISLMPDWEKKESKHADV